MALDVGTLKIQLKTAGIKLTKQQLKQVEIAAKKAGQSAKGMGSSFGAMAAKLGVATVGLMAMQKAIRGTISVGMKFEQAMANVKAISGATGAEFKQLEATAKALGASTKFTASEVAGLQTEFAKLGFTTKEIIGAQKATLSLAAATGTELPRAAEVAGATLRGFGIDAKDTSRVTDVMALSFSKSALDMEKFAESMKFVAPIAKSAGFSIEGTTAMIAQLANVGIHGSLAGTALKNVFIKMADSGSALAKAFGGPVTSIAELQPKLLELKEAGIGLTEAIELTDKRSGAAFLTLVEGADSLDNLKEAFDGAGGSAERMAEVQLDTLEGRTTIMNSALEGLGIRLFDMVEGPLNSAVIGITDFAGAMDSETIKSYGAGVSTVAIAYGVYRTQALLAAGATKTLQAALIKTGWGALAATAGVLIGKIIEMNDVFAEGKEPIDNYKTSLEKLNVELGSFFLKEQAKNIAILSKAWQTSGLRDAADQLGLSYEDLQTRFKDNEAELHNYLRTVMKNKNATFKFSEETKSLKEQLEAAKIALQEMRGEQEKPTKTGGAAGGDGVIPGIPSISAIDTSSAEAFMAIVAFQSSVREAGMTDEELRLEQYDIEQENLISHLGALGLSKENYLDLSDQIEKDFDNKRDTYKKNLRKAELDQTIAHYGQLAGGLSSFIGVFAGGEKIAARLQQAKAISDTYSAANKALALGGGWPLGAVPMFATITQGLANVAMISKSIGDISKFAATGMDEVVTKPTLIMAGEAGAESVQITPLEGPNIDGPQGGGGGTVINVSGNVMTQDFVETDLMESIREAIRKGGDLGIT